MRSIRSYLFLLLLIFSLKGSAQSLEQWLGWGDAATGRGEYYGASRFYAEALKLDPGRLAIQWKQAEASRLSEQYDKAAILYERVYQKDQGRTYPEALRWLAEMQMSQGLYDEAEKSWRKLIQRERKKHPAHIERAENALAGCEFARTDTTSIDVEHL